MKAVIIAYTNISYSARTLELLQIMEKLAEYRIILSPYFFPVDNGERIVVSKSGIFKALYFLNQAKKTLLVERPDIVILCNNQTSLLIPWVKKALPFTTIVYDSAELYIDGIPRGIKPKLALYRRFFEKRYLNKADVVFAANEERANIMEKYFSLPKAPKIFDNMHRIEAQIDLIACRNKYDWIFEKDDFVIIYSGGLSVQRMTFQLIQSVLTLGQGYRLIIVGGTSTRDSEKFQQIAYNNPNSNIHYLGKVTLSDLRYLLKKSDISVALYTQDTTNNKFCASGKVFEGIFEGRPILTSTNPPLVRLCKKYGVGISSTDLALGIQTLQNDYKFYVKNVEKFIEKNNLDERIDEAVSYIKKYLK